MPLRSCIFTHHMKETYITCLAHDFSLVSVCNSLSVITKVFTTSSAGRPLQRFRVWKNKIRYITQQWTRVTRFSKVTVFVESKGYTKKTIQWTEFNCYTTGVMYSYHINKRVFMMLHRCEANNSYPYNCFLEQKNWKWQHNTRQSWEPSSCDLITYMLTTLLLSNPLLCS